MYRDNIIPFITMLLTKQINRLNKHSILIRDLLKNIIECKRIHHPIMSLFYSYIIKVMIMTYFRDVGMHFAGNRIHTPCVPAVGVV